MPEIRSVSVRLDADVASYIAKMRLAGAETDKAFSSLDKDRLGTLNRQLTGTASRLDKVSTSASKVTTEGRKFETELDRIGSKVQTTNTRVDSGARSIDKFSGRLGLLESGLTAVGPATIPITAAAIPAVTALASGLGFAAAGAGTLVLAFEGVGDALTKVNKAALEPTDANLQAAHLAMSQLPPDARAFVRELQRLRPEISQLQAAAGSGLFPGLTDGLHAVQADGPLAERVLHNIGGELGDLARDAGRSLASDRWRPFLRFIGREAPHELGVLGHAAGDVTHGLAELWMAMSPLNRDVDAGIRRLAQDFDRWATSLGKTKDFQSFVAYIQTNGPHVVDLLGDTADLFVDIVKAAAPLGGPTLQALDLIVKALDAIANSPLGTPILLLLQINSVLKLTGRALGALGVDAKLGIGGVTTSARTGSASLKALRADAVSAGSALRTIGGNVGKNAAGGTPLLTGVNKEGLNSLAKGAALAGGMAFAVSGLDSQMGLANTTSLALAGSLGGPVGIGVGAAAGSLLDLQAALEKDRKSMEDFQAQLDVLVHGDDVAALQNLSDRFHKAQDASGGGLVGGLLGELSSRTDAALSKTKSRVDDLSSSQHLAAAAAGKFGHAEQVAARQTLAMRQAAQTTADQFFDLSKNADNAKVSLHNYITGLTREARAITEFGQNAVEASDKGLRDGLIQKLQKLGPVGALRMKQLADASQTEIARANHAFGLYHKGTQQLEADNNYLSNHPAVLSVDGVPQSLAQIRAVQSALRAIHDKTVRITTERFTGGRALPGDAEGGTVPGPRYPYGDKVLRWNAPGEEVVSNRFGQADMNRPALKAANRGARLAVIGGLADGGTVGALHQVSTHISNRSSSRTFERVVERLPRSLRLAVDGDDLYALIDSGAQGNYESNRTYEEAHG